MNEQEIIDDWLEHNFYKLPTIAYSKAVVEFIQATADCIIDIADEPLYKVNGCWQKITEQKEY